MMAKGTVEEARVDKWMWAVRLFKTRSLAADACRKGHVLMGGSALKASKSIRVGDVIQIKRPPVTYSFRVLALSESRMGARLVPGYVENVTPSGQLEILELSRHAAYGQRDRGAGRPTKKDRREIAEYTAPQFTGDDWDWDLGLDEDDD